MVQQVQVGGKPKKMDKATVELEMKAAILMDYNNTWEYSPILRYLRPFYNKYFYKPVFDRIKVIVVEDMYKIENEMKAFFNMQTFV